METKELTPRQEAKKFVGDGSLRDALKSYNPTPSDEVIGKIIDACSFVLKV